MSGQKVFRRRRQIGKPVSHIKGGILIKRFQHARLRSPLPSTTTGNLFLGREGKFHSNKVVIMNRRRKRKGTIKDRKT